MEHWLRMMLAWDPKDRGGPLTTNTDPAKPGRVSCFEILEKILETRVRLKVTLFYGWHKIFSRNNFEKKGF